MEHRELMRGARRRDTGATLVEIVIAVVLVGMVLTVVLGALGVLPNAAAQLLFVETGRQ